MPPLPDEDWDAPVAPAPSAGMADWDAEDWDAPAVAVAPTPKPVAAPATGLLPDVDYENRYVPDFALRPVVSQTEMERQGLSMGKPGSPVGVNDLKTVGAAVGGGILDVADRFVGKIGQAAQSGLNALLPSGARFDFGDPADTERPVSAAADTINRLAGTGAPTVAQTKEALRRDPAVDAGFKAEEAAAPMIGDTALMLATGGRIQAGAAATKAGTALAGTRTGRAILGTGAFGAGGLVVDPEHPKDALVNGALAYTGMKAGEFAASPFLARILTKAGETAKGVNPLFVKTLTGIAEGTGQSLVPTVHDGEWRSAILEGDWGAVATNVALNAVLTAGAPDISPAVKKAYIAGRVSEVPPQYRARLDALAGPIYDAAREVSVEAAKAKGGAKPWTAGDEAAARAEIHAHGATGKVAEAQLAKAKRNTYDADLVTPEMLAEGKADSVNAAASDMIARDRAGFAADSQARVEQGLDPSGSLVAGKRETEALEMGEAAAEGQATREAARAAAEPGDPAMLARPLVPPAEPAAAPRRRRKAGPAPEAAPVEAAPAAAPEPAPAGDWDLPVAPPPAPGAPAESTPTLALIGRNKRGEAIYGQGDKFYVRGSGGRLGAAHPADVKEARGEAAPADPRAMADEMGAATGGKVEDLLSGSAVLTRGEQDAVRGAWSLLSRAVGEQGTAADVYEPSPAGATRSDMAAALRTIEHVYDLRVRRGEMPTSEASTSLPAPDSPGTLLAGTKRGRQKSADTLEAEATKNAGLAQLVRREGGIDLTGTNLTGEVNGLRLKESGTTGLVSPKGGGRSKSVQRLMDAAREEGFDLDGWTETQFVERVLSDAQGDRTLNPEMVDAEKLGDATLRRQAEQEEARWADAPPGAREKYEAEMKADREYEQAERDAIEAEARGEVGDDDVSFEFGVGDTASGVTREGEAAVGPVVRATDRSLIIETPEGNKSVPKDAARRDPPGIYLGSGLGGAQQFVEAVGPAIEAGAKAVGRYSRSFSDWVQMKTAPKMTRASPTAGRYAGGIVNANTTAKMVAPVWIERVFGDAPTAEALAKFGHAAGEWQFKAKKGELEAQLAATTDPVERARIEDRLDRVGTIVGADGSPFATQADLDAYMASPEWKAQSAAWRAEWNKASIVDGDSLPGPERMYRDLAQGGDHDPDLFVSDPRDVLRVNMKPVEPDAEGGTRPVYRSASGSLRAPILKGHAFSREFTGAAAKYDFDPAALIENTYQRVHREWLKPRLYGALVASGDAQMTNLKDPTWKPPETIKGHDVARFPISEPRTIIKDGKSFTIPGKTLYVRDDLQGEVRQTLRTDPAAKQAAPLRVLNTAALTGIADNVWNLMLDSQIPASAPGHIPGKLGVQAGIANNVVGLIKQLRYTVKRPIDYSERVLRLSADASWRGARDGNEWSKDYILSRLAEARNPLKIPGIAFEATAGGLQRVAQRVHEAGRFVLDDAFSNLVRAGLVKDTPVNRREFVNRLGQYAGRAMDRVTEMARDLGIQPFVVAKKKSLAEIGRKAAFSPGAEATSKGAAVQLRAGQLMRLLTFAATGGVVNFVNTGSFTGRKGTPLGNLDTGSDDSRTGVPQSWPWLGDVTGQGPMLRAVGATGFLKAKDEGLTTSQAIGDAAMGPLNAAVLKWLSSPALDFGARLVAGETIPQALGGGGGPKAEPPGPGEGAMGNKAAFAVRQAAQLGPVVTQLADSALGTNISPRFAPDATGEFFDLLKSFAPKRGTDPEILADMREIRDHKAAVAKIEWLAQQRRNKTAEEWWALVQQEINQGGWDDRTRYLAEKILSRKRGK